MRLLHRKTRKNSPLVLPAKGLPPSEDVAHNIGDTLDLPVEIWERIAFCACTDGGYTAYVLSLVCRNASLGARWWAFDIVAVKNPNALKSLLRAMHTQKRNFGIHHLLIHLEHPLYTRPFLELLSSVSSNLHTLVLLLDIGIDLSETLVEPSTTFPRLHKLSLVGNTMVLFPMQTAPRGAPSRSTSDKGPLHVLPMFPLLSSLHIAFPSQKSQQSLESTLKRITLFTQSRHSPKLTHLTMSSVPRLGFVVHPLCHILRSAHMPGTLPVIGSHVHTVTIVFKPGQSLSTTSTPTSTGVIDRVREWNNVFRMGGRSLGYDTHTRPVVAIGEAPPTSKAFDLEKVRHIVKRACEGYEQHLDPDVQPRKVIVLDPDEPTASSLTEDGHPSHVFGSTDTQPGAQEKQKPGTSVIWPDMMAAQHDFPAWKKCFLQDAVTDEC
jgi:hypothetical protein